MVMEKQALSIEEREAIGTLKRLAKKWPPTLWLFADGNSLHVMRGPQKATHERGGMNQDDIIESFRIPNDGGDW